VIEELSRVDGSVGIIVAAQNSLCSNHIFKFGTEAQKKKYLTGLASGKKLGAWSLTEPEAGSDAGGTKTTAVRDGNFWVLNGAKTFTTNGHYADYCVAMAVTDKSKGSGLGNDVRTIKDSRSGNGSHGTRGRPEKPTRSDIRPPALRGLKDWVGARAERTKTTAQPLQNASTL